MRHSHLPRELKGKVRDYYELCFPGRRLFDEENIMLELSRPLREEEPLYFLLLTTYSPLPTLH